MSNISIVCSPNNKTRKTELETHVVNGQPSEFLKDITPLRRPKIKAQSILWQRAYRWQKAMRIWNKAHEPEVATLQSIEDAFKKKWPCAIAVYSNQDKTLKMTIPWISITFTKTRTGCIRGYMFLDNGKKLTADIFMSPSQLTDFLPFLMNIVYTRTEMEEFESRLSSLSTEIDGYISHANHNSHNEPLPAWKAINIFELFYEKFKCLSSLNRYEEALAAIKDALFYYNLIEQFEEKNNCTLYSCILGDCLFPYDTLEYFLYAELSHTLLMLGRLNEAIMSYRSLYERKLKYIENNRIWPGYNFDGIGETEQYSETVAYVAEYCHWVEHYCDLLSIAMNKDQAIKQMTRAIDAVKSLTILKYEDSMFYLEQLKCSMESMSTSLQNM